MKEETYKFQAKVHDFAGTIVNKIPSNWACDPNEYLAGLDKEGYKFYRIINSNRIYKFDLLEKYKDRILGHATNSAGQDLFLIQINKFAHFQAVAALHPLDEKVLGIKTLFFTKGGNDFADFINENKDIEHTTNERTAGFFN